MNRARWRSMKAEIPRGFSVLSGDAYRGEFSNRMTQLPAARRGSVELEIRSTRIPRCGRRVPGGQGRTDCGSPELLIVEPLPSGAKVVPSSLDGCFDRAEILPGRIVFFLNRVHSGGSIRYELEGVFPGSNLISPTLLRRVGPRCAAGRRQAEVAGRVAARRTQHRSLSPLARRAAEPRRDRQAQGRRRRGDPLLHGTPGLLARSAGLRPVGRGLQADDLRAHGTGHGPRPRPSWSSTAKSSRRSGPASRSRSINC